MQNPETLVHGLLGNILNYYFINNIGWFINIDMAHSLIMTCRPISSFLLKNFFKNRKIKNQKNNGHFNMKTNYIHILIGSNFLKYNLYYDLY